MQLARFQCVSSVAGWRWNRASCSEISTAGEWTSVIHSLQCPPQFIQSFDSNRFVNPLARVIMAWKRTEIEWQLHNYSGFFQRNSRRSNLMKAAQLSSVQQKQCAELQEFVETMSEIYTKIHSCLRCFGRKIICTCVFSMAKVSS